MTGREREVIGNRVTGQNTTLPQYLFPFYPVGCSQCFIGGQGRNRTADAGLFRAAYRIAEVV